MNYKKKGYYARDYRDSQSTNIIKGTIAPREMEEFKGTKGYIVKYFIFYYNNKCHVHKEVKYKINYQPQELRPELFKGIEEVD